MTLTTNLAAELEATRDERDRLRLTLTGTRAALDLVQEECDAAHEALDTARQQLAREVAAKVEANLATQSVRAHAEDMAARLVQVIWEDAHTVAELRSRLDIARHFGRQNATRATATAIDLRECEEAYAGAEWVAARLVEVICRQDTQYRHVARALWDTVGERDAARNALAEANARGDEWSRVAHGWAQQRDDARRRAEEAERVIAAYRGTALRDRGGMFGDGAPMPDVKPRWVDLFGIAPDWAHEVRP